MYDFVIKLAGKFYDLVKNAQDVIQSRELIVDNGHFDNSILVYLLDRNEKYNIGLSISEKELLSYIKAHMNRLNLIKKLSGNKALNEHMTLFQMLDIMTNGWKTAMANNDPYVDGNILLELHSTDDNSKVKQNYTDNEELLKILNNLLFLEASANVRWYADRTSDTMLPETPRNEEGLLETLR